MRKQGELIISPTSDLSSVVPQQTLASEIHVVTRIWKGHILTAYDGTTISFYWPKLAKKRKLYRCTRFSSKLEPCLLTLARGEGKFAIVRPSITFHYRLFMMAIFKNRFTTYIVMCCTEAYLRSLFARLCYNRKRSSEIGIYRPGSRPIILQIYFSCTCTQMNWNSINTLS